LFAAMWAWPKWTPFNNEGQIIEVTSAKLCASTGEPTLGIKTRTFTVVASLKQMSPLVEHHTFSKLTQVSANTVLGYAGLSCDFRVLARAMVKNSFKCCVVSGAHQKSDIIAKELSSVLQQYTQVWGVRPFGVDLLLGGYQEPGGPQLFKIACDGCMCSPNVAAIGAGAEERTRYMQEEYQDDLLPEHVIAIMLKALALEPCSRPISPEELEISVCDKDDYKSLNIDALKFCLTLVQ
ncbi:hypothetical protein KR222_004730, partial [Zaprionus bogoriensis]